MKFLAVNPSPLMYTKIYLRLEPLGLELVAEMARQAGHEARLIDLQVDSHKDYFKLIRSYKPDIIAFSCNYVPHVPEILDLAKETRNILPESFIFVGGHSGSFVANEILEHAEGAIDCVLKGEGEAVMPGLLEALANDRKSVHKIPGAVTLEGEGPPPSFVTDLDLVQPARDLLRKRRKYFIGVLDPCASIEFSRGCPWECNFCSAWTFYGRSYRKRNPEMIAEELSRIKEDGIFIVDDVAFIQGNHGFEVGKEIEKRGIKKKYYLETRGDVLLRNKEVFEYWKTLGLEYMFLGLEAIDAEGLKSFRKGISLSRNFEALEWARSLGITVAINLIVDPAWDKERFETIRKWCMEVPEIVNLSVMTPYPGTEVWHTESRKLTTRDYRLFDIQHAVLPTKLPLREFYTELVKTQQILNMKHLGWSAVRGTAKLAMGHLLKGQTNFVKMLFKFNSVYNPELQMADHAADVNYQISLPPPPKETVEPKTLYVHGTRGDATRALDPKTEEFIKQG